MLAAVATLGFGGAMGLEGPSLYLGASIGSFLQRRFRWMTGGASDRGSCWSPARRPALPPSSRRLRPARSSRSRCPTRTIWRVACCCPPRVVRERLSRVRRDQRHRHRSCPCTGTPRSRSPTLRARSRSASRPASALAASPGSCAGRRISRTAVAPVRTVGAGLAMAASSVPRGPDRGSRSPSVPATHAAVGTRPDRAIWLVDRDSRAPLPGDRQQRLPEAASGDCSSPSSSPGRCSDASRPG